MHNQSHQRRARGGRRVEISAVLIVKDEAEHIADLAASLDGAVDEVVLLDTGSTDDTVALATAHGFRVFHRPWTHHFAEARNAALAHARGRWVLSIDADERLVTADRDELRRLTAVATHTGGDDHADMFWIAVENFNSDDLDPMSSELVQQLRLFRLARFHYEGRVHEQLTANDKAHDVVALRAPTSVRLQHLGYTPQIWARKNKSARNKTLVEATAAQARAEGVDGAWQTQPAEHPGQAGRRAAGRANQAYADFERARLLITQSPTAGLELMLAALAELPSDRDTHRHGTAMAARALVDAGRCDDAIACLERARLTDAFVTQFDIVKASALARSGRDDEAIELLRQIEAAPNYNSSNLDMLVRLPALKAETLAISGRSLESWQAIAGLRGHKLVNVAASANGIAERAWRLAARAGTPDRYLDELSAATDDDEFRGVQPLLSEAHERAALGARHVLTREPIAEPDPRLARYRPTLAGYSASAVITLAQARLDTEPALALGVAQTIGERPHATPNERDAASLVAIRALLLLNHVEAAVRQASELAPSTMRLDSDQKLLATLEFMAVQLQVTAGSAV